MSSSLFTKQQQQQQLLPRLGDINVIAVTDVHSWVGGHGQHPQDHGLDADYGDVLSFYQTLQDLAALQQKDVFFVMNGDFVDGTGLSTIPPHHLVPILQRMPFAAVNMGNHELYHNETVQYLRSSGFIDHWQGNYLTSNTYWQDSASSQSNHHIGHAYTYLYGQYNTDIKILTFGFLYNFENNCEITIVQRVQETVQQAWFRNVLLEREKYNAIMVLAHMDYLDPLVDVIRQAIRHIVDDDEMPIQFINGHSHRRGYHVYDSACTAMEAGRFLDTVGFVSFPSYDTVVVKSRRRRRRHNYNNQTLQDDDDSGDHQHDDDEDGKAPLFRHVFLDANKNVLAHAVGRNSSSERDKTPDGTSLTNFIHATQDEMGLEQVLGCTAHSYRIGLPLNASRSLYGLYMRHVLPYNFEYNESKVFVQSTGALRYSLLAGNVTVDDVIAVSPFEDVIFQAAQHVTGQELLTATGGQDWLLTNRNPLAWPLPYVMSGINDKGLDPHRVYDVYAADFDLATIRQSLQNVTHGRPGTVEPASVWKRAADGTVVTTLTVWLDFVSHKWPCATDQLTTTLTVEESTKAATMRQMMTHRISDFTDDLMGTTACLVLAVVCAATLVVLSRTRRSVLSSSSSRRIEMSLQQPPSQQRQGAGVGLSNYGSINDSNRRSRSSTTLG